jgi:methionyl-tRNA formyltransferase
MTRIVFFGNERLATGISTAAPTLRLLVKAGYDVAAVVSNQADAAVGKQRTLEIAAVASELGIPLLLPVKPSLALEQIRSYGAEIGVLVAYGKIVPQSVIDIFPKGIVNIHPSLLPLHRGPTPIESVILDGAKETGVSIMQLVREMDAGPVYGQRRVALDGDETKQELADKLLGVGGEMLLELLPGILEGSITPEPQDDSAATYDELITKRVGDIDWNKSADELAREIRAYAVWPQSRAVLGGKDVIITAAHAVEAHEDKEPGHIWHDTSELHVHTGAMGVLVIDRLKPSGKSEMTAKAFLAGYSL